jgi:hypothetical protein
MYSLPERFQTVVDAGIPLFELRKTRPFDNVQRDFGYWNVRVREYTQSGTLRLTYDTRWFVGPQAYIEYVPNKRSICTAFAPDDETWHNRVYIASNLDSGTFTIERIHTANGVIPGQAVLQQIKILREFLYEWRVIDGGTIVFRSKLPAGAQAFAKDFMTKNGRTVEVLQARTDPVEKLIAQYRGRWVECPEFQTLIKPKVVDAIAEAEKVSPMPVTMAQMGQSLLSQVARMTDQDRLALAAMLRPYMIGEERVGHGTSAPDAKEPARSDEDQRAELVKMPLAALRKLAKTKGLDTRNQSKVEIADGLIVKLKEENDARNPAAPPPAAVEQEEASNPYDGMVDEEQEAR